MQMSEMLAEISFVIIARWTARVGAGGGFPLLFGASRSWGGAVRWLNFGASFGRGSFRAPFRLQLTIMKSICKEEENHARASAIAVSGREKNSRHLGKRMAAKWPLRRRHLAASVWGGNQQIEIWVEGILGAYRYNGTHSAV